MSGIGGHLRPGGTPTRWHDIDFHAESVALAHAVPAAEGAPVDDVHGAAHAGMRTVHVPHSTIPTPDRPHRGTPDAVVRALSDITAIVERWG